uniref:Uncharacterized protein n=1 Tax=Vitis vinifera TaxID=29760 RepID=A5BI02_VITVI|nr:hypothetical protein VITISV_001800 [Vitis vinifera]
MARWRWLADGPTGGLFVRGNGAKAGDFTFVLGAGAGTTTGGETREADGGVVGGGELQGEEKKMQKKMGVDPVWVFEVECVLLGRKNMERKKISQGDVCGKQRKSKSKKSGKNGVSPLCQWVDPKKYGRKKKGKKSW